MRPLKREGCRVCHLRDTQTAPQTPPPWKSNQPLGALQGEQECGVLRCSSCWLSWSGVVVGSHLGLGDFPTGESERIRSVLLTGEQVSFLSGGLLSEA